ncbi:Glycine cleavage system H protein 2 [Zalerion maritima]|uniref:Glycine cleavage system H protein n=1 Tax=Zalerion maritima TaxID=339359 RepID=A0AAD5WSF2_9PEZI|nr:Glycine cleavage system H protein 2 [Zalerion maritima]
MTSISIGRCMRTARPSTLSLLAKSTSRSTAYRPIQQNIRFFSATPTSYVRKYTKDHEWVDLKGDGKSGTIGISEYAAEQLGDVVYVELPSEGSKFGQGDAMGAVESVKSAADINAPISCKIKDVNLLLEEKPGTINKVPEDDSPGGGWIAKVVVDQEGVEQMEQLMSVDEYKAWVDTEEH